MIIVAQIVIILNFLSLHFTRKVDVFKNVCSSNYFTNVKRSDLTCFKNPNDILIEENFKNFRYVKLLGSTSHKSLNNFSNLEFLESGQHGLPNDYLKFKVSNFNFQLENWKRIKGLFIYRNEAININLDNNNNLIFIIQGLLNLRHLNYLEVFSVKYLHEPMYTFSQHENLQMKCNETYSVNNYTVESLTVNEGDCQFWDFFPNTKLLIINTNGQISNNALTGMQMLKFLIINSKFGYQKVIDNWKTILVTNPELRLILHYNKMLMIYDLIVMNKGESIEWCTRNDLVMECNSYQNENENKGTTPTHVHTKVTVDITPSTKQLPHTGNETFFENLGKSSIIAEVSTGEPLRKFSTVTADKNTGTPKSRNTQRGKKRVKKLRKSENKSEIGTNFTESGPSKIDYNESGDENKGQNIEPGLTTIEVTDVGIIEKELNKTVKNFTESRPPKIDNNERGDEIKGQNSEPEFTTTKVTSIKVNSTEVTDVGIIEKEEINETVKNFTESRPQKIDNNESGDKVEGQNSEPEFTSTEVTDVGIIEQEEINKTVKNFTESRLPKIDYNESGDKVEGQNSEPGLTTTEVNSTEVTDVGIIEKEQINKTVKNFTESRLPKIDYNESGDKVEGQNSEPGLTTTEVTSTEVTDFGIIEKEQINKTVKNFTESRLPKIDYNESGDKVEGQNSEPGLTTTEVTGVGIIEKELNETVKNFTESRLPKIDYNESGDKVEGQNSEPGLTTTEVTGVGIIEQEEINKTVKNFTESRLPKIDYNESGDKVEGQNSEPGLTTTEVNSTEVTDVGIIEKEQINKTVKNFTESRLPKIDYNESGDKVEGQNSEPGLTTTEVTSTEVTDFGIIEKEQINKTVKNFTESRLPKIDYNESGDKVEGQNSEPGLTTTEVTGVGIIEKELNETVKNFTESRLPKIDYNESGDKVEGQNSEPGLTTTEVTGVGIIEKELNETVKNFTESRPPKADNNESGDKVEGQNRKPGLTTTEVTDVEISKKINETEKKDNFTKGTELWHRSQLGTSTLPSSPAETISSNSTEVVHVETTTDQESTKIPNIKMDKRSKRVPRGPAMTPITKNENFELTSTFITKGLYAVVVFLSMACLCALGCGIFPKQSKQIINI